MAVYSSIEFYPPSLNALTSIITHFGKISILSRNVKSLQWDYKTNVENIQSGDFTDIRDAEKKPMLWKIYSFILFTWNMWKNLQKEKPALIILYDPIPMLSYYLIRNFIGHKYLLWYHNHDVADKKTIRKYTIAWWAIHAEQNLFKYIDIFTLPAEIRKQYFPLHHLKGKYFFIPNMPAKSFYNKFYLVKSLHNLQSINLLYQGSIGDGHGLKNIIQNCIGKEVAGKKIILTLIGWISNDYKNSLLNLAANNQEYLFIHSLITYAKLPLETRKHHIGLAIHEPVNLNFSTAGTASNKIYEYAALGLPIILYDNIHYRGNLSQYEWAFFTDLSEKSMSDCIEKIIANYEYLSQKAHEDFETHLNFETYFNPVIEEVMEQIKKIN